MTPTPIGRRVVEVNGDLGESRPARWSYASGLLLDGAHVLTAAHAVEAKALTVRTVEKLEWRATVVSSGADRGIDLAIIRIDRSNGNAATVGCALRIAEISRATRTAELVSGCWAIGFPDFQLVGHVRSTAQVDGYIPIADDLGSGMLSLIVNRSPRPLPLAEEALNRSEWSDMSGAAVFAGSRLVGVITEHSPRRGEQSLTVTPLTFINRLPDAELWWRLLGSSPDDITQLPEEPNLMLYLRSLVAELDEDAWTRVASAKGRRLSVSSIARPLELADSSSPRATGSSASGSPTTDDWQWLLVVGGPGAGKSWLARMMAAESADHALQALRSDHDFSQVELPLFATLPDVDIKESVWTGIVRAALGRIAHHFEETALERLRRYFLSRPGRFLLVLDGLDEVVARTADTILQHVTRTIDLKARILITSRPGAWRNQLPLERGAHKSRRIAELRPLRYPDDVEAVIAAWLTDRPAASRVLRDTLATRPELAEAASTPLVCAMFCLLAESPVGIPERRSELYHRLVTRLIRGDWRYVSNYEVSDRSRQALRELALAAAHDDPQTGLSDWSDSIAISLSAELTAQDLDAVGHIAPTYRYNPDAEFQPRRFIHRSVREYLLAEHLATLSVTQVAAIVEPHLWFDPTWENIVPVAIARHPARNELATLVLTGSRNAHNVLEIAARDGFGELRRLVVRMAAETSPDDWNPNLRGFIDSTILQLRYAADVTQDWLVIVDNGWRVARPGDTEIARLMGGDVPWRGANIEAWMDRLELGSNQRVGLLRGLGSALAGDTYSGSSYVGKDLELARAFLALRPSVAVRMRVVRRLAEILGRGLREGSAAAFRLLGGTYDDDERLLENIRDYREQALLSDAKGDWFVLWRAVDLAKSVAHLSANTNVLDAATNMLVDVAMHSDDGGRELCSDYWIGVVGDLQPSASVLAHVVSTLVHRFKGLDGYNRKTVVELVDRLASVTPETDALTHLLELGPWDSHKEAGSVLAAFARKSLRVREAAVAIVIDRLRETTDSELYSWARHFAALEPIEAERAGAADVVLAHLMATPAERSRYTLKAMRIIGVTDAQRRLVLDYLARSIKATGDVRLRRSLCRRSRKFADTVENGDRFVRIAVELLAEADADDYHFEFDFRGIVKRMPLSHELRLEAANAIINRLAFARGFRILGLFEALKEIEYRPTPEDRERIIAAVLPLISQGDGGEITYILDGLKMIGAHTDSRVCSATVESIIGRPIDGSNGLGFRIWRHFEALKEIEYRPTPEDRERIIAGVLPLISQGDGRDIANILEGLAMIGAHTDSRVCSATVESIVGCPIDGGEMRRLSYVLLEMPISDADQERLVDALIQYMDRPAPLVELYFEDVFALIDGLVYTEAQARTINELLMSALDSVRFAKPIVVDMVAPIVARTVKTELNETQRQAVLDCCLRILTVDVTSWYWVGPALLELRLNSTELVQLSEAIRAGLETSTTVPSGMTLAEFGSMPTAALDMVVSAVVDARRRGRRSEGSAYVKFELNGPDPYLYDDLVTLGLAPEAALEECLPQDLDELGEYDQHLLGEYDQRVRVIARRVRQGVSCELWSRACPTWAAIGDALYMR